MIHSIGDFLPHRQFIGGQFSLVPSNLNTLLAVTNPSLIPWNHVIPLNPPAPFPRR